MGRALMGRALMGWALMGPLVPLWAGPLWAGPLWAPLGSYGPGPCGPPLGPYGPCPYGLGPAAGALMGPLGPYGPGPLWASPGPVWAAPLWAEPLWAGPLWAPWALPECSVSLTAWFCDSHRASTKNIDQVPGGGCSRRSDWAQLGGSACGEPCPLFRVPGMAFKDHADAAAPPAVHNRVLFLSPGEAVLDCCAKALEGSGGQKVLAALVV